MAGNNFTMNIKVSLREGLLYYLHFTVSMLVDHGVESTGREILYG